MYSNFALLPEVCDERNSVSPPLRFHPYSVDQQISATLLEATYQETVICTGISCLRGHSVLRTKCTEWFWFSVDDVSPFV